MASVICPVLMPSLENVAINNYMTDLDIFPFTVVTFTCACDQNPLHNNPYIYSTREYFQANFR